MGSDANDREQAIEWYRELAEESSDPFVDLHLAILEGEAGHLPEVRQRISRWTRQVRTVSRCLRDCYRLDTSMRMWRAARGSICKPLWQSNPFRLVLQPAGGRIAERAGDRPLLVTIETADQQRIETLVWRSRAFALLELGLMVVGEWS